MGDYLRRAYDEAERAMSHGDSDATRTRQDVADEIEEAVKVACDRILPARYMTEESYQHLRKRVAELQAENDRLREQIRWLKKGDVLHVLTDQELADQQKHEREMQASITALNEENTKLRELVAKYSAAAKYLCGFSHCNECNLDCASVFGAVPSGWDCARMLLDKEACELGVGVD